ncbi:hypothetical protein AB0I81_23545 [Nonomuraea sp. NPDC050404]|uniref:hypothetical protein n=1 Tax=Nonomuraea sp. NPDC050404 TaxID=3155783 RepID=UPI0033C4BF3F
MSVDPRAAKNVLVAGERPEPGLEEEQTGSGLESVTRHEELVRLLAEQFARADASLRELQARADRADGARLPRATCADMLAGRRFPKKAVMVAFLRACQVPEQQVPAWERAWERVRLARLPTMVVQDGPACSVQQYPASDPPDELEEPDDPDVRGLLRVLSKPIGTNTTFHADEPIRPGRPAEPDPFPPPDRWPGRTAGADRNRTVVIAAFASLATGAALGALAAVAVLGVLAGAWIPELGTPAAKPKPETPLGWKLVDDGRAFGPGGSSRFTVTVDPANTGVRLIRRLDAGIGRQHAAITVNGSPAGSWQPLPAAHDYRWRNQSVDLPPSVSAGRHSLTVVNTFISSDLDFNEFSYVVRQKLNGVWSTADTLDVGPEHTASEAVHDYHLTGRQTFSGPQDFAYPPNHPPDSDG